MGSKIMIRIVNAQTGEVIEREPNAAELKQIKQDEVDFLLAKNEAQARELAKNELLAKLGITLEEAKLLLR
jgi:hypothetical protein